MASDELGLFVQESEELLADAEDALLAMEEDPNNQELVNAVFRCFHTIKGTAGLFDFTALVDFTHILETALMKVRSGEVTLSENQVGLFIAGKDHLQKLVNIIAVEKTEISQEIQLIGKGILAEIETQFSDKSEPESLSFEVTQSADESTSDNEYWYITIKYGEDLLRHGMDPAPFIQYLERLGDLVEVRCKYDDMPDAADMDPEACYLSFEVLLHANVEKQQIADVFEFVWDDCEIKIVEPASTLSERIEELRNYDKDNLLGEMLLELGFITDQDLEGALRRQKQLHEEQEHKTIGEVLVETDAVSAHVIEKSVEKQENIRTVKASTIRVDTNKLERLFNLVGELIITSANASILVDKFEDKLTSETMNSLAGLIGDVRDVTTELRMVEIGSIFSRFQRVVRDISKKLNKDIKLELIGAETELDKTVIEKITDPLTHLIRNAIDHGIESGEAREAIGKPAKGNIALKAYQSSGSVVIEVQDDGSGIEPETVFNKAVEKGLVKASEYLEPEQIYPLILLPGFSTAAQVSELSGRGVGMDVVKRNIESLGGTIQIQSEVGSGTTFRLRIPLTMAIIDGFLFDVAGISYALPLKHVAECIEYDAELWEGVREHGYISLRGSMLPLMRLRNFFGSDDIPEMERIIVLQHESMRVGLIVDDIRGEFQAVIKPLNKAINHDMGYSGSTILGDGRIAMILDVQYLAEHILSDGIECLSA